MFSKQNLLAALGGGILMFILGYLIWVLATAYFFEAHSLMDFMKDEQEVNMPLILVGNILAAFGISSLYGKWARGYHSFGDGFIFGAWVGFIFGVGYGLVQMGTANMMDSMGHAVEALLEIGYLGITGGVIALIYKATDKKEG
ncbi:MAG: hypothetical protein P8Z38_02110 [Robiginitalea sp.]